MPAYGIVGVDFFGGGALLFDYKDFGADFEGGDEEGWDGGGFLLGEG